VRTKAAGSALLSVIPATFGVPGYFTPIVVLTPGYTVFQMANNAAVRMDVHQDQRSVISGMLNLTRNLGLITGVSVLGSFFAHPAEMSDIAVALPEDIAIGMRTTFTVAETLIVIALDAAITSDTRTVRAATPVAASNT